MPDKMTLNMRQEKFYTGNFIDLFPVCCNHTLDISYKLVKSKSKLTVISNNIDKIR